MRAAFIPGVPAIFAGALFTLLSAVPAPASAKPEPLFSLAVERTGYLLGEPVYLRIQSTHGLPPSLEEGSFLLAVKGGGDGERIYHPPLRLRSALSGSGSEPDSGALASRFARLIACDGDLLFRKPGRYRLRLVSASNAGARKGPAGGSEDAAALSDSLEVVFKEPTAPADKKAYAILSRNPGEYALAVYLEGGDQLKEGMAMLNEMAAFESAYTRLASFILSSDWSQDFTDYKGGKSRSLDLQKALAWAQWDKGPGVYIPLRNAYRLQAGADILAARDSGAPGLMAVRGKLAGFMASLTPREAAWFRAFSASLAPRRPGPG